MAAVGWSGTRNGEEGRSQVGESLNVTNWDSNYIYYNEIF